MCNVKGRYIKFWKEELCAPRWVIDTIMEGYVLPLMSEPPLYSRPKQHSPQLESEFVSKVIVDLLDRLASHYNMQLPRFNFHSELEW